VHLLVLSEKCDVLGVFFFLTVAGQQVLDRGVECGGDQGQLLGRRARDVLVLDLPHVALAGSDPFGQRLQGQSSLQSELANALSQGCWHRVFSCLSAGFVIAIHLVLDTPYLQYLSCAQVRSNEPTFALSRDKRPSWLKQVTVRAPITWSPIPMADGMSAAAAPSAPAGTSTRSGRRSTVGGRSAATPGRNSRSTTRMAGSASPIPTGTTPATSRAKEIGHGLSDEFHPQRACLVAAGLFPPHRHRASDRGRLGGARAGSRPRHLAGRRRIGRRSPRPHRQ